MRGLLLRVGAAIIGLTGVLVAVLWPASCYLPQSGTYVPIFETCESHVALRVLIAGGALALALVMAALSYERARSHERV